MSTSVTAFIGRALKGPTDKAITIHSFSEYEYIFGKLWKESNLGYTVFHYFLNGGNDAIIIRVHHAGNKVTIEPTGAPFILESSNPGLWGKCLKIKIDPEMDKELMKRVDDKTLFNLTVTDTSTKTKESFLNLSTDVTKHRFVVKILEEESKILRVKDGAVSSPPTQPPIYPPAGSSSVALGGSDGDPLQDNDIMGVATSVPKTGLHLLNDVDLFNMLCIPPYNDENFTADIVYTNAVRLCEDRRAILIVDPPEKWTDKNKARDGIDASGFERHKNARSLLPSY